MKIIIIPIVFILLLSFVYAGWDENKPCENIDYGLKSYYTECDCDISTDTTCWNYCNAHYEYATDCAVECIGQVCTPYCNRVEMCEDYVPNDDSQDDLNTNDNSQDDLTAYDDQPYIDEDDEPGFLSKLRLSYLVTWLVKKSVEKTHDYYQSDLGKDDSWLPRHPDMPDTKENQDKDHSIIYYLNPHNYGKIFTEFVINKGINSLNEKEEDKTDASSITSREATNAYQNYIASYDKLTNLMSQGKGDTPEAQQAYKEYKEDKERYEQIAKGMER